MKFRLSTLVCMALMSSCSYHIEDELYPAEGCQVDAVSYVNDIVPILENWCYQCHDSDGQQGGVTLDSYGMLETQVQSGRFRGAILHENGFSPMPKNQPKLPECEIRKIISWIDAGSPNN